MSATIDYSDPPPFHHMRVRYTPRTTWPAPNPPCVSCGEPSSHDFCFWESGPTQATLLRVYMCWGCSGMDCHASPGPRLRVRNFDDLPPTRAWEACWRVAWAWTAAEMAGIDRALGLRVAP